jgi:hypothetical protein
MGNSTKFNFDSFFTQGSTIPNFGMVLEQSLNPYGDRSLRVPFYMTSTYRQELGVPGVTMLINPTSVSFRQSKRITRKNTQSGAVFFHWSNALGRNNDILELSFTGQTGNINIQNGTVRKGATGLIPGASAVNNFVNQRAQDLIQGDGPGSVSLVGDEYITSGAAKLSNFWNLYSLSREPVLDPKSGAPIYYYISYASPIFGNTFVTFIGHFNNVLDFTDDANSPNNKIWNFSFTVLSSMPSMNYIYSTIVRALSTEFTNPLG